MWGIRILGLSLFTMGQNLVNLIFLVIMFRIAACANDLWPIERPDGMPNIVSLEVMCGKDHMDVHLSFSQPFEGIVSSKGQHSDPRCIYVPPSTGKTFFSFRISYSRCGTKPDLNGQFYENTVVVQYDKDLLEVWDEAKRLRCEWFNDYEKTASKPPMVIADLDVIQLDFRGDNVDCWMEIQQGKGPWAPPVSGIVPLGSTMTLVVAINDFRGEFDMRVKSCVASDGAGHVIKLSDEYGCVLRPKMISKFLKARASDDKASVITYAFFHAFKFPDALSVHIKCKVEICRHGCLDHCQQLEGPGLDLLERKDTITDDVDKHNELEEEENINTGQQDIFYDDIIHTDNGINSFKKSLNPGAAKTRNNYHQYETHEPDLLDDIESLFMNQNNQAYQEKLINPMHKQPHPDQTPPQQSAPKDQNFNIPQQSRNEQPLLTNKEQKQFFNDANQNSMPVHGPRLMDSTRIGLKRMGMPALAGPRSLNLDDIENHTVLNQRRKKRSIKVTDRTVRSTDVGVSGIYDVISEADLAFSPDTKQEAVTVFQGKITEEVVYGICMPVPGFSVLFILVISATIISALLAGSLLYRYQLQKEAIATQHNPNNSHNIATWMTLRLFNKNRHTDNCSRNIEMTATAQ